MQHENISDALQRPPSFDEMVEMIKKLFTDYLEDVIKAKPSEIAKSWERYKTLNHLFQEEQPNKAAIGVNEDEDQLKFSLERGDLWKIRALAAELALEEKKGAEWVKASERVSNKHSSELHWRFSHNKKPITSPFHLVGSQLAQEYSNTKAVYELHQVEWLDESGQSKNEFVNILDNALDAGKDVLAELKKQNESKEGNKEREIAFAEYLKIRPYSKTMCTTEQLWNEWNNQQKK